VRTDTKLRSCGSLMLLFAAACGLPDPSSSTADPAEALGATPQIAQTRPAWRQAMRDLKLPKRGCFQSDFPSIAWKEVACETPPNIPYPPHLGRRTPQTVGGGTDWAARVDGATRISAAEGSFDTVSGVTSIDSTATGGVSEFSLQLNTQFFSTPTCAGSSNPAGCQGWEQFVYSNTGTAFIQYWLLFFNNPCPAGWFTVPFGTDTFCFKNGSGAVNPGHQNVSDLPSLRLEGAAVLGGDDTITMTTPGGTLFATNNDSELTLAAAWQDAEFNIVGDGNSSEATFNAGSTVTVHTTVHNGTTHAPTCVLEGFTAETNSLTLVGTAASGVLPAPAIVFNQTNVTPFTASSCAAADGTGDPHMHTVLGTGYDFMGIGDYLWAQRGANFVVQTRQISGAPSWPLAAVNKEVATRMGKSRIAVCSLERLEINGKATSLGDGKQINLPDATVERHGNVFLITGQSGDSVRAVVNSASPNYIDVHVGFGQWPDTVLGLLGNGKTANELVARDGTVLTAPVSFQDLYSKFGDSWRVPAKESLLCSNEQVERRNPEKPFCVKDLDPKIREHAQGVCAQFGIKQGPLFDACVLDVAMLGDAAARAFVNAPPPVVIGDAACR
jgi:hypothetical protein